MLSQIPLLALAGVAAAFPNTLAPRATYSGTATFNDYIKQGQTVCGPLTGQLHSSPHSLQRKTHHVQVYPAHTAPQPVTSPPTSLAVSATPPSTTPNAMARTSSWATKVPHVRRGTAELATGSPTEAGMVVLPWAVSAIRSLYRLLTAARP